MSLQSARIAFIKARWHADIVDQALAGFSARAVELGHRPELLHTVDVPGAYEMPLMAKRVAQRGDVDAIVAAALVVDGGIYRHDFVAAAVVDGLMRVQLDTDVPVFSVSLTPHHFHEGEYHSAQFHAHFVQKGREAADAVDAQLRALAGL
ncbi:MAG: 6,7-dimethyl-8-ribityllumazine synthase [Pseudomonadota bacterium]